MTTPIRIKTFRSKTLQEAFHQIRAEFGSDASILETKAARFGMFGRTRIEVTASSTSHEAEYSTNIAEVNEQLDPKLQTGSDDPREIEAVISSSQVESEMETEGVENAREGSRANDATVSNGAVKRDNVLSQLQKELLDAGIDGGIVSQWIEAIRETVNPIVAQDIWSLRSEVSGWIRDLVHAAPPIQLNDSDRQVIALVGPPGAGKTTALAKIAANFSMEQGVSVGVLSTDTFRLGSNYLLRSYAEVLGWSFEVAESIDQVAHCMTNLSVCRIVLVDTWGCSPDDSESLEKLKQLLEAVDPTQTHLVLSSTCNSRSFLRYEKGFELLAPNRMLLTRVDEAGGLGAFFPCLQCTSLPVSYLSNGQNIPADLIQATATRLAQQIMS